MKERFEATEWEQLKVLPFHLFRVTAIADGEIQKEEIQEFLKRLIGGALGYKDRLHRELARDIVDSDVGELLKGTGEIGFDPKRTKQVLKEKLTPDEYHSFVGSLFIDAINIAAASKTGWLRKKAISDEERDRLTAIGVFWEVNLPRLAGFMSD